MLTSATGVKWPFECLMQVLNNEHNEIKRAAVSGCLAGSLYGLHRASVTQAVWGCTVLGSLAGGAEVCVRPYLDVWLSGSEFD